MDLFLESAATLRMGARRFRCASGKGGIRHDKREGDGATPVGEWPVRRLFYRVDKLALPGGLAFDPVAIAPDMGWCDAPDAAEYNRLVRLPFAPSHENLWRDDDVYDLLLVLGYNDEPVVAGKGSAIFLHLARPQYEATEGCVAVSRADMLEILPHLTRDSRLRIASIPPR